MKIRSKKHVKFVASQPCIVTGYQGEYGVGHHLLRAGGKAMGTKACDSLVVPLHHDIHEALHKMGNEVVFFQNHGLTYDMVVEWARHYARISPDRKIREISNI